MQIKQHMVRLAKCHHLAYEKLFTVIDQIPEQDYFANQGMFFKNFHGTLNHMLLVDQLWFYRLRNEKMPYEVTGLDQELYEDKFSLKQEILKNSLAISDYVSAQTEDFFEQTLRVKMLTGSEEFLLASWLVATLTNHGTHHRGQLTACLSKLNFDYPSLDLPFYPEI